MMKHMIIKRAKRREKTQPLFHDYLNANVNLWIIMQCSIHTYTGWPNKFLLAEQKNKVSSSMDPISPISFICTIYTHWLHHNESWFWEKDYTKENQDEGEEEHSLNHDPSGKKFDEIYSCTIILSLSRLFYFLKPMATHLNDKWWEKFNATVFSKLRG